MDRFASNRDQNDRRPTLHIVKYISPVETRYFAILSLS